MTTRVPVSSDTPDPSATDVFAPFVSDFLTEAQMESINLHRLRDDLDWPLFLLLGDGREVVMTTSNRHEAMLHFRNNSSIVSYISSQALLKDE